MSAKIISKTETSVTIQVTIPLAKTMIAAEESILLGINDIGKIATAEALQQYDTCGQAIVVCGKTMTTKGKTTATYQTPYGEITLERHLYQTYEGGKTYCPLENDGRIMLKSTPRFAKMISSKYAEMGSNQVKTDMEENHGRKIAKGTIQSIAETVGSIATLKEEEWEYSTPKLDKNITTVGIGLDGTCMLLCEGKWRETMVGTLSLYDNKGERQHTTYIGTAPEYGKEKFYTRLAREIMRMKKEYPNAEYVGIADGAKDNWTFLESYVSKQVIDFYHASGYLGAVAKVKHPQSIAKQEKWLEENCHELKHTKGTPEKILETMKELATKNLSKTARESLERSIVYFTNHKEKMIYSEQTINNMPIGSGVTEAACKTLVKERLCKSGMRWKTKGAQIVLSLRGLIKSHNYWGQFWEKIDQLGVPLLCVAAT